MKRIILGISILLMLVQNGFAKTDAEFDKKIAEQTTEVWKQIWRCNKASVNHKHTADVNICLKSIKMQKNNGVPESDLKMDYVNVAVIYEFYNDKLNAYKYYMKSARLGSTHAQKNLDNMCKSSPWACK